MVPASLLTMTAGAERMAQTDPHGLTLSLIAVTTVFTALLVLYFIYSFIGKASRRGLGSSAPEPKAPAKGIDDETAAAIALALEAESGSEVEAAIALAIELHLRNAVHDAEPGFITIAPQGSAWSDKSLTFRKSPVK